LFHNLNNFFPTPSVSNIFIKIIFTCNFWAFVKTEGTAATVLTQMQTQRQQLQGANQNVWEMRQATEKAKKDITSMVRRTRRKKLKLQMIAAALAAIDLFLFLRLVQCGGRFFCRSNSSSSSSGQYNDNSSSNSYYDGNY